MLPDLERLIRLQELETAVDRARLAIEAFPAQRKALAARLGEHAGRLEAAEGRLAEHRAARRNLEKDVAAVQSRLTRFKEQLMAVKTNKEYHAVQSEIAGANAEIQSLEDRILEGMLEADELSADIDRLRLALAEEETVVGEEQRRLEQDRDRSQSRVDSYAGDRAALVAELPPALLDTFDTLIRGRRGIAVGAAQDGRCGSCQVRLRPQLYNDVRLNQRLIRCESCQRILYYPIEADASPQQPVVEPRVAPKAARRPDTRDPA
jgi:predicted  nucleic acid-binding Zn-ribbon protein